MAPLSASLARLPAPRPLPQKRQGRARLGASAVRDPPCPPNRAANSPNPLLTFSPPAQFPAFSPSRGSPAPRPHDACAEWETRDGARDAARTVFALRPSRKAPSRAGGAGSGVLFPGPRGLGAAASAAVRPLSPPGGSAGLLFPEGPWPPSAQEIRPSSALRGREGGRVLVPAGSPGPDLAA